ncbi:MAG: hypothetical protein LIO77_07995 [Rikenellaceae bacterium]|nr:hypothetical protein [Rikenellaceae bacterium]
MKPIILSMAFICFGACGSCSSSEFLPEPVNNGSTDMGNIKIDITIENAVFTATLEENDAGKAFNKMLPLTLDMADVNRNEKYIRLDGYLPTDPYCPGTVRTGDLMLWGSDGLVLFYKRFSTPYSYTPLGYMDDPSGLEEAVGTGDVTVQFCNTGRKIIFRRIKTLVI